MECKHELGVLDLIPVFSWIASKGRCRYCGTSISIRYPLSEIATAVVYVSLIVKFGLTREALEMIILFSFALCAAFADIEDYLIPDRFIIAGIILRILFIIAESADPTTADAMACKGFWATMQHMGFWSLVGGLSIAFPMMIIVLIFEKVSGKDMMGGGDLKLLFMLGIYFNWAINLFGLLLACIFGIIGGVYLNKKGTLEIPWGPFIIGGTWLAVLFGEPIINWYLGLF